MRRYESRDALFNQFCIASFVWDSSKHPPIPFGGGYIPGAVPEDHIVMGGWVYTPEDIEGRFTLSLGPVLLLDTVSSLLAEWTPISPKLQSADRYFRVDTEVGSRLRVHHDNPEMNLGRFVVYLFYIHAGLRVYEP